MSLFGVQLDRDFALEFLVLSGLIYLFLRFLRQTRGNRVVRGLIAALLLGTVVLYGMSAALELEQLTWLLDRVAGFAVVILAIIFQPELRRAMAQLGARKRTKDTLSKLGGDTLEQIGSAVRNLASTKTGALIVIEGEAPLDVWIDRGQAVQAPVRQLLLQSLFAPEGALHDGAVILRGDKVEAAACFLPLSDDLVLDATTGTRHRAALGLAEETDATTIVVSEETGRISICRGGRMQRGVAPELFETELRETLGPLLGGQRRGSAENSFQLRRTIASLRADLSVLSLSGLIAAGLLGLAYFKQSTTVTVALDIVVVKPGAPAAPRNKQLVIVLPDEESRLRQLPPQQITLELSGSKSRVEAAAGRLRGVVQLADFGSEPIALLPDTVFWEPSIGDVSRAWEGEQALVLQVEKNRTTTFVLEPRHVAVDVENLDPRFTADPAGLRFVPPSIEITGSAALLERLDASGGIPLLLEPILLSGAEDGPRRFDLNLAGALRDQQLSLRDGGPVRATIDVRPFERKLGPIERELALVSLEPGRRDLLDTWTVPDFSLRCSLWIETRGLLPAGRDPSSSGVRYTSEQILEYVAKNLMVYVDLSELPENGDSRTLEIRTAWRNPFETALWPFVGGEGAVPDWVELRPEFVDGNNTVRVEPRPERADEDI